MEQPSDSRNKINSTRDQYYARNRTTDINRKTPLSNGYKPPRAGPVPNQSSLAYTMMGAVVEQKLKQQEAEKEKPTEE